MCLIAFAWNAHPDYPLVLVANRDEFHARPAAPLAYWDDAPDVLGGRDLREGGGWLLLDRKRHRLAAVTNVREEPPQPAPQSRGKLVRSFVEGRDCAVAYSEMRRIDGSDYGGFNLIVWDGHDLAMVTNRLRPRWETAPRGLHGVSNGAFDAPWPKTTRLVGELGQWLGALPAGTAEPDIAPLFAALADEHRPPDAALPDTGIGLERERLLSPPFIRYTGYGTRASSVVLIHRDGHALFAERSFGDNGVPKGEVVIRA